MVGLHQYMGCTESNYVEKKSKGMHVPNMKSVAITLQCINDHSIWILEHIVKIE